MAPQNKILTMSQCRKNAAKGLAMYQRARVNEIADLGSWCWRPQGSVRLVVPTHAGFADFDPVL